MKFLKNILMVMSTISLGVLMIREANNLLPYKSKRGPINGTKIVGEEHSEVEYLGI